jgi:hypothetical protein
MCRDAGLDCVAEEQKADFAEWLETTRSAEEQQAEEQQAKEAAAARGEEDGGFMDMEYE